jgi:hypothetical protein
VTKIPDLWQSQVEGKKNTGAKQEVYKPRMSTQVIIQKKKEFVDFLHVQGLVHCHFWKG